MLIIRKRAPARVGLAGNPSDGYHGKTLSVAIHDFYATVILYEWERIELLLSQQDHSHFDSIDELAQDVKLHGYYGGIRLVKATIKRFVEFCHAQQDAGHAQFKLHDGKFAVRYESNIPRQVGLAGSSAIIVATLLALMEFYQIDIPQTVLPSLALSVEHDELGIAAGLQDRVAQVYGSLVYMDFTREVMTRQCDLSCGRYEEIDPRKLPPLYVAYSTDVGEPTEVFHTPLRELYDRGDAKVHAAMQQFALYAEQARDAILKADYPRLAHVMNANFDLRQTLCQLPPLHVAMIEEARKAGASAKFAGSGGAIVGDCPSEEIYQELETRLRAVGCKVLRPTLVRSNEEGTARE